MNLLNKMSMFKISFILIIFFTLIKISPIYSQSIPNIRASNVSKLIVDANANGLADGGDIVEYNIKIANCSLDTLTGVIYYANIDPNTELISNSFRLGDYEDTTLCDAFLPVTTLENGIPDDPNTLTENIPEIPSGQELAFRYRVRVEDLLPIGTQFIVDQGVVVFSGTGIRTDDPRINGDSDPTRTAVGISASALPNTGEELFWRSLLIIMGIGFIIIGSFILFGVIKRKTRTNTNS